MTIYTHVNPYIPGIMKSKILTPGVEVGVSDKANPNVRVNITGNNIKEKR